MRIINQDKQQLPLQSAFRLGRELPGIKKEMISGLVTSILDGNSFELSVQVEADRNSIEKYTVQIRIYGLDKPPTSTLSGILAKLELEKQIVGRKIECEILKRDDSNYIIARLPKRYLTSSIPFDTDIDY